MALRMSKAGLAETKSFEGFRARPYRDAGGTWTVGYGETSTRVVAAARLVPLPERAAARLLRRRIDRDYGEAVRALRDTQDRPLPLTQGMYDALTDLAYNKGTGVLRGTTLSRPGTPLGDALRHRKWHQAARHILDYDRDRTGTRLEGLGRRRAANRRRFLADLPD
jgi:lysozyme